MTSTTETPPSPYYVLGGQIPVSREALDFCRRRVGGLTAWGGVSTRPLIDLLANAYVLGLADAAEALFQGRDEP